MRMLIYKKNKNLLFLLLTKKLLLRGVPFKISSMCAMMIEKILLKTLLTLLLLEMMILRIFCFFSLYVFVVFFSS